MKKKVTLHSTMVRLKQELLNNIRKAVLLYIPLWFD